MQSTILALILVAAFVAHGHCLKCYNCNSLTDANCGIDNFGLRPKAGTCQGRILDPATIFTSAVQTQMYMSSRDTCCEGDDVVCTKTTVKVSGKILLKRTCYRANIETTCIDLTLGSIDSTTCYCNTDYCNGGDTVQPQVTTRKVTTPDTERRTPRMTTLIEKITERRTPRMWTMPTTLNKKVTESLTPRMSTMPTTQNKKVLRCYRCKSSDNGDCSDDNSDFSNIATCEGTDITCMKEKLTVSGDAIIERKCYMANHNEGCKVTTLGEYSYETCYCKSDHCNGIDGVRPHFPILLIVTVVALLI